MKIYYKIVEVWPDDHLIVARFWTDTVTEEYLANTNERLSDGSPVRCRSDVSITLPIPTPTGDELENIILRNAPTYWLSALEAVKNPNVDTSLNHIKEMLNVTKVKENIEEFQEAGIFTGISNQLSDDEIRELIAKVTSTV